MNAVLKQEWKSRVNTILIVQAILFGVNAIAFISQIIRSTQGYNFDPTSWFVIAIIVDICIVFLPLIVGSGNIGKILFKDQSYLLLSLPRNGFQLLGGRLIIGVAECMITMIPAVIYTLLITFQYGFLINDFDTNLIMAVLSDLARNMHFVLIGLVLSIISFLILSILISTASIFMRSILKTKRFALLGTVVLFFFMIDIPSRIGFFLHEKMRLVIPFAIPARYYDSYSNLYSVELLQLNVPLEPVLVWLAFATIYFIVASLLLEKKVEV